jgi:photosystem II stability/assembly factor-like uncharacterized protein
MRNAVLFGLAAGVLVFPSRSAACDPGTCIRRINRRAGARGDSVEVLYQGWGFPRSVEVSNYDGDCYPWVSADGRFLFFGSINFAGPERRGNQGNWDIYLSRWDSVHQRWGEPRNLGTGVNTPMGEHRPSCTRNADTLFFERDHDIYMSTRAGDSWAAAETLPYPINTRAREEHPAISPDGQRLYFTSNREHGGRVDKDIWVALRNGGVWDSVYNLGSPFNTPNEETRPFESFDGQRFYFCNNHGEPRPGESYGGPGDIYVSVREGDSWGPIRLVAAPVNDDLVACTPCESPDGRVLYFGSHATEGSRGDEDIWVAVRDSTFLPGPARGYGNWLKTGELDNAFYVYDLKEGRPGTVYAATACSDTAPLGRVFVTTDRGANWIQCGELPGAMAVYSLLVEGDTLFAGTYPNGDVFRSCDGGISWQNTAELPQATAARGMTRLANGDILVGASPYDVNQENPVYRSTDEGATWIEAASLAGINPCFMVRQVSSGTVFCGGWGIDSYIYVQRSTDNGATWDTATVIPQMECEWTVNGLLEYSDGTVYLTGWIPSQRVGVGGGFVYRSTDDGVTWDSCSKILRGDGTHNSTVFTIIEDADGAIMVGMQPAPDSVVFASTDGGTTWNSTGGLDGAFECLCLLRALDGTIYAGTTPNGDVFRYEPTGVAEAPSGPPSVSVSVPFGRTVISYTVPIAGRCEMTIHDNLGREVRSLVSECRAPGRYDLDWDRKDDSGRTVPAGTYTLRLRTPNGLVQTRLVLAD